MPTSDLEGLGTVKFCDEVDSDLVGVWVAELETLVTPLLVGVDGTLNKFESLDFLQPGCTATSLRLVDPLPLPLSPSRSVRLDSARDLSNCCSKYLT